ncbi:MAG: 2-C-methyl-D-erythritol 4-phosphate cytidylyltransferase [bacterium]|nr:2-C-methyl-D-erythritol 4-phosphate cytidylyltransferase [bacterium]
MKQSRSVAIVLAAGRGKRMNSDVQKQYLMLGDRPVLYHSLKVFEDSFVNEVILVVGEDDIEYCRSEIVEKYKLRKVKQIVAGGRERYHSVMNGLRAIEGECCYVFIHDGARPFVTQDILRRAYETVCTYGTAVVAMPSKDTVKIADDEQCAKETPDRRTVWMMQTPQVFSYKLIQDAYEKLADAEEKFAQLGIVVTDDAMVVEMFSDTKVKFVEGSYGNIKITTPEDLVIANALLS